jgi:deoxyribonuclease-1
LFKFILSVVLFLFCSLIAAAPANFDSAKTIASRIYAPEKQEFYCGCAIRWLAGKGIPDLKGCGYQTRKNGPRANRIEWEHVMPAQQFGSPLACWKKGGREHCGKSDALFKQMEADLFNLKPAIGEVNGDRAHYRFAMLPAQAPQYGSCEVKVDFKSRLVEPRAEIRGDIARIHFYMADKYQLPLAKAQQQLFMAWHQQDPVDETERKLQQRIAQQMGHANDFVTGKKVWQLNYKLSGFGLNFEQNKLKEPTRTAAVSSELSSPLVSKQAPQQASGLVLGNKNSKKYHLSHCSGYRQVSERNQQWFESEQQALDAGFKRAGNCAAEAALGAED